MACLLLVSFSFVLLPLCLTISDDSHPHCFTASLESTFDRLPLGCLLFLK